MPGLSTRKVDGGRIGGSAEIANCIAIRMIFTWPNGKTGHCIIYGKSSGSYVPSVPNSNSLFTSLSGGWSTNLGSHLVAATKFNAVAVRDMTLKTNPEFLSTGTAVSATGVGSPVPDDTQLVLTANVNERGRGAKGRIYMGGWQATLDTGSGQADPIAQNALTAWGTDIPAVLQGAGLTAAVAKPARQDYTGLTGSLHPARAAHIADVISYVCQDAHWDTQRRRGL